MFWLGAFAGGIGGAIGTVAAIALLIYVFDKIS